MKHAIAAMSALMLAGCAPAPHLIIPDAEHATRFSLAAVLSEHPVPEGQNIAAAALGHTDALSYFLVQIRDHESPHVHANHDLGVTLLRGSGTLYVRGQPHAMRPGDVAIVPRGVPHYFVNDGPAAAAAFVTFTPLYDGKDQIPAP